MAAERVEAAQRDAVASISNASQNNGIKDSALESIGAWTVLTRTIGLATLAVRGAAAAGAAAAVATTAGIVSAGLAVLTVNAYVVEGQRKVKQFSRDIVDSYRAMDGSKERARAFAGELSRIPLIGEPVSTMFNLFSDDAQQSELALASLAAVIEDGEVKTRAWATIGSAAIQVATLGFVDLREKIVAANQAMAEQRDMQAFRAGGFGFDRELFRGLDAIEQQVARAHLADLQGVEEVREAERQRLEDAERLFDLRKRAAHDNFAAARDELRAEYGFVEGRPFNPSQDFYEKQAVLEDARERQLAGIAESRAKVGRMLNEQMMSRVAAAEAEAQTQRDAEAAEQRRVARNREEALAGLAASARAEELRAVGQDFEAQRVEIESRAQMAITRAMEDGDQERADLERRYADARIAVLQQAALERYAIEQRAEDQRFLQAEAARERELDAQRRANEQAFNEHARESERAERLDAAIAIAEARAEGRDEDADRIRIESDFWIEIQRALDEGNQERAMLLERLRDLRLNELHMQQGQGRVRNVTGARLSATTGGKGGRDKVEVKDQEKVIETLKSIDSKLEAEAFA